MSLRAISLYSSLALFATLAIGCLNVNGRSACAPDGKELMWRETVKLSNNEEIIVNRGEKQRCVGEPGRGSGWLFDQAWIEADLPDAGHLRWDTSLSPWLLDRAPDGTWYIVGTSPSSSSVFEYGLGSPTGIYKMFVAFHLVGNKWIRIKAAEFPSEFTKPNLLVYSRAIFGEKTDFLFFDGETYRRAPADPPLRKGDVLSLERKDAINFPRHRDLQYIFRPTLEQFDDSICYYRCVEPKSTVEKTADSMEGRVGRLPTQNAQRK